ncbi:MAG: hypothetical protein ACREKR_05015 [Candidatus Methylomirabilales bacterium]
MIQVGSRLRVSSYWDPAVSLEDQQLAYRNQRMLENLITVSAVQEA